MTTTINEVCAEWQFRGQVIARFGEPVKLPSATVASIATDYPAADWPGTLVYLSDGAGSKFAAVSNGVAWYYLTGVAV